MIKALLLSVEVFLGCFALSRTANAEPITTFYNQASWIAALPAGAHIGPYAATGTVTQTDTTVSFNIESCPAICILDQTTTTYSFVGLNGIFAQMGYLNICDACTATTDLLLTFDNPIVGFGAISSGINEGGSLKVNGVDLPDVEEGGPTFFGLTGKTFDFDTGCCTDNPARLDLENLIFATLPVPEPSALSLMLVGMFAAGVAWRRNGKVTNQIE